MSSHTQVREAHERATLAVEAVKELAPSVANSANAVNQLVQMVYTISVRLTAAELRIIKLLEANGMLAQAVAAGEPVEASEPVADYQELMSEAGE